MGQPLAEIPVFNYVMSIRDREFIVTLTQDMMSQWEDHHGRTLEDQLQGELEDSTHRVLIADKIFAKALEMVEKERLEESKLKPSPKLTAQTSSDIAEMDRLLLDFFWQEVNPLLSHPLQFAL